MTKATKHKIKSNAGSVDQKLITLPRLVLTDRQLCDLGLILNGAFAPLKGFLDEKDYRSVVEKMRLANGDLWPIPIVLDAGKSSNMKIGQEVILCDKFGVPRAILKVSSVYTPDKLKEARLVYGTTDTAHPGVKYLLEKTGDTYIGGKVLGLPYEEYTDSFHELRLTPAQLKAEFARLGWKKVIAFQTRNPIHRGHYELLTRAAREIGGNLLIHPSVGLTKEGDIDAITRIRCYQQLHEKYLKDIAKLSLLPLAMRMAGPREALWHALIRKNYGATHFIIGRDHAGPGKDAKGVPFYGPYDAQTLVAKHTKEIGIVPYFAPEVVYVKEVKKHMFVNEVKKNHTIQNISGTEFRDMLRTNKKVPAWFSFPEVIRELKKGVEKESGGITIFFTGLPSSGKSTIARMLSTKLAEVQDRRITLLDGDVVRLNLSKGLGFSKEDRDTNIERIGFVAGEITKHGGIAICAALAPYQKSRDSNRQLIGSNGTYIEVFVNTPLNVCEQRDIKDSTKKPGPESCRTSPEFPIHMKSR